MLSFFFNLDHVPPVPACPSIPMQQQPVGLSAATGPFAKVRLQSGAEGKFVVVVVFFCRDFSLRPCTCSSLLTNAAVAPCGSRALALAAAIAAAVIRYMAVAVARGRSSGRG